MAVDSQRPIHPATDRQLIAQSLADRLAERLPQLMQALDDALSVLARHQTPGAVHDTRVATRRFRAALRNLKCQLPPVERRRCATSLREIAQCCSDVRDADVRRHLLRALLIRAGLQHDEQGRLVMLAASQGRKSASRALRRRMNRSKWSDRLWGLRQNAARLIVEGFKDTRHDLIPEVLERRRRLLDRLRKRTRDHGHRPLHRLRSRIKDARYFGEDFGPILGTPIEADLAGLRDLQKLLGDFHDEWRLKKWLRKQYKCYLVTNALRGLLKSRRRKRLGQIRQLGRDLSRSSGCPPDCVAPPAPDPGRRR
jgi:CHAD domain-containing protein